MTLSKQQKNDLLVIGELNMDLILNEVDSFPEPEKEKIANDFNLTLGSSSAIFAANSARLGLDVGFCGMVGNDDFGKSVINQLKEYKVDTSLVTTSEEHKTGLTAIIRHEQDRAMVTYPGAMEQYSLSDISDDAFEGPKHLHISSIFLQPKIKDDLYAIVKKAKTHDMTVSLDPQWDPKEAWDLDLKRLFSEIDVFLPNEAEFLELTETGSVKKGLAKVSEWNHSCTVVVKRGTKGATFLSNNSVSTVHAYLNNDPVDAVGAGDSFDAGFIYQFLRDKEIEHCVQFGNITGAVSTTRTGGTAAITSFDHVLDIAKNKLSITTTDDFTR